MKQADRFLPLFLGLLITASVVHADGGVTFDNLADDAAAGLTFSKHPSTLFAITQQVREDSLVQPIDFVTRVLTLPAMGGFGLSGTAVWDFDRDGDLDIYVANGPGAANSLFSNQLMETGSIRFVDVAASAGVDATSQDSHGVCYGDIDNDGDPDLVVLGRKEANLLFENQGDGTFSPVTPSGIEAADRTSTGCSLGDVNGDGSLDLVVANAFDLINHVPLFFVPFGLNEHNQLFLNNGDNTFIDVSASSGIIDTVFPEPTNNGQPTITWATAMVDIDLDGDLDILFADDQGAFPEAGQTFPFPPFVGTDRGLLHVFTNDGDGHFVDEPILDTSFVTGAYMGLAFGDFNCDGHLDFFATNFGDYAIVLGDPDPPVLGFQASRWFLGNGDGTFVDPGVGSDIVATPFGWGTEAFDYDNDGDQDILFHGGLDLVPQVSLDNQGAIYQNQACTASFIADTEAVTTDHSRRSVRALASGDLDQNGFVDLVVPSEMNVAASVPLEPNPLQFGSPYDATARFARFWAETASGLDQWTGATNELGDLVVELNSGNANSWVSVTPVGTVGITDGGGVNRDGIGAVVFFKPDDGQQVISPVTGGASYLSQSSRERIFGLGSTAAGTIEILWPGGVRNRLYDVESGERLVFPEIPCSFDAAWSNQGDYVACVTKALNDVAFAGVLEPTAHARFLLSAIRAFKEP